MKKRCELVCDLCGTTKNVQHVVGGPFSKLCPGCREIVSKVIREYHYYIAHLPLRLFAHSIVQTLKENGKEGSE